MIVAVLACGAPVLAQDPPSVEELLKHWQARQDRVKSFRYEWTEDTFRPKGHVNLMMPDVFDKPIPPMDMRFSRPGYLSAAAGKLNYVHQQQAWFDHEQRHAEVTMRFTFDGKNSKSVTTTSGKDHQVGQVRKEDHHSEIHNFLIQPLLLTFRSSAARISPYAGLPLKATGDSAQIQKARCWCYRVVGNGNLIWVDPNRHFIPLRVQTIQQNVVTWQLDVQFERHEPEDWIPISWRVVNYSGTGKLISSVNVQATKSEFNIDFSDSEFDLEFTAGTRVMDDKNGMQYIQRAGGERRVIRPNEVAKPYSELAADRAADRLPSWRSVSWTAGSVFVIVVVGVVILFMMRRRSGLRTTA